MQLVQVDHVGLHFLPRTLDVGEHLILSDLAGLRGQHKAVPPARDGCADLRLAVAVAGGCVYESDAQVQRPPDDGHGLVHPPAHDRNAAEADG